ncbi:hypothetical protein C0J52_12742 [Blattella germanica]|nr:hypothetical protein C0J52_12742 [Blattella germanica]
MCVWSLKLKNCKDKKLIKGRWNSLWKFGCTSAWLIENPLTSFRSQKRKQFSFLSPIAFSHYGVFNANRYYIDGTESSIKAL